MPKSERPTVFISSTSEDLKSYREKVRDIVHRMGMFPLMFEYNPARGDLPACPECMRRVREADVVVAIVAHSYGWIPADQPADNEGKKQKSITWLECAEAWNDKPKKEVLGFVASVEAKAWPHKKEIDALFDLSPGDPEYLTKVAVVQQRQALLEQFKREVGKYQRGSFSSEDNLAAQAATALADWQGRHGISTGAAAPESEADTAPYLAALAKETGQIELKGIKRDQKDATRFSIVDLYIPLNQLPSSDDAQAKAKLREARKSQLAEAKEPPLLQAAIKTSPLRLLIIGYPGAGKSTFAKRLSYEACAAAQLNPIPKPKRLLSGKPRFPILVRLSSFAAFIAQRRHKPLEGDPVDRDSPEWLLRYLSATEREHNRLLRREFVSRRLNEGAQVILDGLDEASEGIRDEIARLIQKLPECYNQSEFIVTSRPSAFGGITELTGFRDVWIGPLTDKAIDTFAEAWCGALFDDSESRVDQKQKLLSAVEAGDIAELARNPLMLTCLAVLRWNNEVLPDRRAELYDLILAWLARQREHRAERPGWERCLQLHQKLALTMHSQANGKQVEIDAWRGIEALCGPQEFRELADADDRKVAAKRFLEAEENDSGIILGRDKKLRFWHQQFQEHLAAQALAGRDQERRRLLFKEGKLLDPDWRETVRLLAGVMLKTAPARLDDFLHEVIDTIPSGASLEQRARTLGLIGGMLRDVHSAGYRFRDRSLQEMVEFSMEIFDKDAANSVDEPTRADAGDAIGLIGDRRLEKPQWVRVDEGEFWMGAQKKAKNKPNYDRKADADEAPVHKVWVSAFEIGLFPVTVVEYARFVDGGGYGSPELWSGGGFGEFKQPRRWEVQLRHPNRPVVEVSWFEAAAYAAWIGGRLPTEAEWERAARDGHEGKPYPWGGAKPDESHANFDARVEHATAVGLYPAGAWMDGPLDMAGNVWEWCSDWYADGYYASSPERNPTGPPKGQFKALRGGSWSGSPWVLRVSFRGRNEPGDGSNFVGFRCLRESSSL